METELTKHNIPFIASITDKIGDNLKKILEHLEQLSIKGSSFDDTSDNTSFQSLFADCIPSLCNLK